MIPYQQSDDVFFLTATEIQAIIEAEPAAISSDELQTRSAQRRLAYEYWMTVLAPDAIDAEGTSIIDEEGTTTILKGIAASSGRVRGRARSGGRCWSRPRASSRTSRRAIRARRGRSKRPSW